jgi:hypothetical protein
LWWVFSVLGCMVGSCRRGLAPWVILADGPGGLFMPGFAWACCHGDGTPTRSDASGTKAATDVPPGVSRYPVLRLIFRRASSACSGAGVGLPALPVLARRCGVNGDTLVRPRLGRPTGRLVGGRGARKLVHNCAVGRLGPGRVRRAQQAAAVGPLPRISSTAWPAAAHRRERANICGLR